MTILAEVSSSSSSGVSSTWIETFNVAYNQRIIGVGPSLKGGQMAASFQCSVDSIESVAIFPSTFYLFQSELLITAIFHSICFPSMDFVISLRPPIDI